MGNKIKAIIVLIAAVVIVGALHTYVFKPRMDKYKNDNDNLERLSNQFKSIVSQVSSEKDEGINNLQSLATEVDEVIKIIEDKIQTARNGFGELDKKLKIIERYDPSVNYRDEVITQIDRMRQLEASSSTTKLTVSSSWEVDGGITEGRFGTGFKATEGRALAFANVKSKPIINPNQGTIEFFVKPDWDPTDTEIHHKCLFMAIDSRKFTRDQITQRLELEQANNENADNPMFERMNIQQMMPVGPGPFQKDSMIAIYKGEGATLSFELRDYVKPPSIVTAYISDWKPDTWYHITATWEPKRQALYINGSNRGVPLGGGQSIREARDAEEDALFTGGGGGYGMGMMGMGGMGMGMMGMGGMGMGGMGMGGMGMGMGGMGGGMGFGGSMGPTTGSALTSGISIPTMITGIYLGTDETGGFAADCTFDDLRIQNRSSASPTPKNEIQRTESTMLIDHFNNELPDPEDLPNLLMELAQVQRLKSVGTVNPTIREVYESTYTLLKHALGVDEEYLKDDSTTRMIRQLYCMNYIRQQTNRPFTELVGLFQFDPEIMKNDSPKLHRIVEFQKLCYDLAQQAIDDQIFSINNIVYKGHGYNVDDKELEDAFDTERKGLRADLMSDDNILMKYDWAGGGGGYGMGMMGMGGMGMGGMGMGMGMMGMGGMGGYGMGGGLLSMFRNAGTSDIEMRQKAQMLGDLYWTDRVENVDPSKIDQKLTIEDKVIVVKVIIDKIEQYKTYQKYYKDELIPPEVIEKFNQGMEDSNQDYYIKRSLTMDLNADYNALMNYMYDIEYGPRVQTINSINITNQENGQVNVVMDVESHTLENVAEETEKEGTTGGVSMR